ncbi:MAG: hypothetical protein AABW99_03505 [archaeon]
MLDFILSKMNLLILVTAIFAIVSFFTFGLTDITKVNEAGAVASRIAEKSFALVSSPNYCFSDRYVLDNEIMVAGSGYYYVLKISKTAVIPQNSISGEPVNVVVFSVYPRTEIKNQYGDSSYAAKAIAADSFRTEAEIHLYSQTYNGTTYEDAIQEQDELYVDPQAQIPFNSVEFIKEVDEGQPKLYIIACNSATCLANKTFVGNMVHPEQPDGSGGFRC